MYMYIIYTYIVYPIYILIVMCMSCNYERRIGKRHMRV